MNTADVVTGTFDVCVVGPPVEPSDLLLVWLIESPVRPDQGRVTVQACPRHHPDVESASCPTATAYEVAAYVPRRSAPRGHTVYYVKLDTMLTHLAGPVAADESSLLDWALDPGMHASTVYDAVVVIACSMHGTVECLEAAGEGPCIHDECAYAVDVVGAEWAGG